VTIPIASPILCVLLKVIYSKNTAENMKSIKIKRDISKDSGAIFCTNAAISNIPITIATSQPF